MNFGEEEFKSSEETITSLYKQLCARVSLPGASAIGYPHLGDFKGRLDGGGEMAAAVEDKSMDEINACVVALVGFEMGSASCWLPINGKWL